MNISYLNLFTAFRLLGMTLKPEFVALLQNNDIPSESTIQELTESLKEPLNELQEIDIEIERLCALVENLKIKRQSIQEIVDVHNTILSPVRRLPIDVLHEIFFRCLPTHRNPIMKSSEAPVLLTRICSSWRAIALSSPRIWSKIHIPLPGDPCFSQGYGMITDQTALNKRRHLYADVLQRRCDVVRRWLSRAGTCPLSISITHPGSSLDPPNPKEEELCLEMFKILLSFADRWSDVDISMPEDFHNKLQANIKPSMFPSLKSLKVNILRLYSLNNIEATRIELLAAPSLRKITIRATLPGDIVLRPVWNRLTHITLASSLNDRNFFVLLKQCPNLVFGYFVVNSFHWADPLHVDRDDIILPCLKSFFINNSGAHDTMSVIFKAIQAPALTRLSYHQPPLHSHDDGINPTILLPAPVIPLLSNSTLISNLALSGELPSQDLEEILRRGEKITHIVFGRPSPSNFASSHSSLMDPYVARPDVVDLNLLSINSSAETLLPRLQSLEAYRIASFTDEDVLDLIKSRINAFKRGETTALNSVKIHFQRRKQKDITEDVSRLAKEAGVELKLDLIYAKKGPKFYDHLSPSFGLSLNDCSWSSEII